jgi:hypothetical protein
MREQMYLQALEELIEVKKYMKYLRDENGYLQTFFASEV